jgi:hypothetical protein
VARWPETCGGGRSEKICVFFWGACVCVCVCMWCVCVGGGGGGGGFVWGGVCMGLLAADCSGACTVSTVNRMERGRVNCVAAQGWLITFEPSSH